MTFDQDHYDELVLEAARREERHSEAVRMRLADAWRVGVEAEAAIDAALAHGRLDNKDRFMVQNDVLRARELAGRRWRV